MSADNNAGGDQPEGINRVFKRLFATADGQRMLEWIRDHTEPNMHMPQKTGTELGYYQGRYSLYLDLIRIKEKEDGWDKPIHTAGGGW